jgi:hypothetical protein
MAHMAQFNKVQRRQKMPPSPPPDNYFELHLSINTFCALIWTLFGDKCDYYKGLLEVCKTLDQQEVHIIRDSFTADVCRRITWAILSNGHSFFNTVLVELQFWRGKHFKWPTSLIHKITDNVRFSKPIERPHYPTKWLLTSSSGQSTAGNAGRGGGYGGGNNQSNNQGSARESNRGQQNQGGRNNGGGGGACPQQQLWVDDQHPCIITMMADYVAARGLQVKLNDILDASNKRITDLPTIPEYLANRRPFVCWAHILGRCNFTNCVFKNGHVPRSSIPDAFAKEVVRMLTPGVNHCTCTWEQEGSPSKRQRPDGQN